MKLLIISHTPHYKRGDQVVGWGPTVQEIDAFSTLFKQVRHVGCMHLITPPDSALPYQATNIEFVPLPSAGGDTLQAKLDVLKFTPMYLRVIARELDWADIVQLRCPANIPLLTLILLILRHHPKYRWFKYAGNWKPDKSAFSYTLQRWILQKNLAHGLVTVNGQWPKQPQHIHSFLNPCLTEADLLEGRVVSVDKTLQPPYVILHVGQLNESKGAWRVLEVAHLLRQAGVDFELHLLGDGHERLRYEALSSKHGLQNQVFFHGWQPKTTLGSYYATAHFNLLPSDSEGWPKVLGEGMAYGVVPLAGAVSAIPQILAKAGSGLALPPLDVHAFAQAIQDYISNPQRWHIHSQAGITFAPQFSYSAYLDKLCQIFRLEWNMEV